MSIAFELNSQARGRAILAALKRRFPTARGDREQEREICLDTFDWRLWRAGAILAGHREGRRWRLRWLPRDGDGELRESLDVCPAFARDLPEGRLRRELEGLIEMRRLLALVELTRASEELRLLDRREKTVARVRLETARVRGVEAKTATRLPPRLVALPVRGYDRAFGRLIDFLEDEGLEAGSRPLLDQAYRACGLEPGDYSSKVIVALEPELPVHRAMRRIHRTLLETVRRNEDGLRQDLDSEFLHDSRVAVRRTRAALTQVKGVLPRRRTDHFRQEFAWLGGQTGRLRDLDVYLLKFDAYRASLPEEVGADLGPLEELLRSKQKAEHRRVARVLRTRRYQRLVSEWALFLADEEAPGTPAEGLRPTGKVARERILEAHAKVIRKGRAIGPSSPDGKLHKLRIDCKKLRYLLEFFRGLYAPEAIGRPLKALKALQDNLGDFNDLSVQQRAMRGFAEELAAAGTRPATLMALGRLIAILAREQREERRRFHDRFERFDRPKVDKRLKRLVESALA